MAWARTLGDVNNDYGYSVAKTSDGGYIVTGTLYQSGYSENLWLNKTLSNGTAEWTKTFGGTGAERGRCVKQTTDNGYIICGQTNSYGAGADDFYLIKTDANGTAK